MTVYERLLAVQELDTRADQLRHRLDTLPEREAVRSGEDAVGRLDATLVEARAERDVLGRSQQRLEDEIAMVQEKRGHEQDRLYSGSVTAPKELQAIQEEIDALDRRIRALEDDELELMELAEPLDARLARLAAEHAAATSDLDAARSALREAAGGVDVELEQALASRAEVVASVGDDGLVAEYERLRPSFDGIVIARLVGTMCGGCHLSLSAVEGDRLRKLPADARATCDECGRLLVR